MYSTSRRTGKKSSQQRSSFIGARPYAMYPRWDADAMKYIQALQNAGGQIPLTWKFAINKFYKTIKQYGILDKMEIFYLYIGGTAACHAINGKTPGTYNITWNGTGIRHDINGVTGASSGSTSYGNTTWNPSTSMVVASQNNISLGSYYRKIATTGIDIGCSKGTSVTNGGGLYIGTFGGGMYGVINNNVVNGTVNPANLRPGLTSGRRSLSTTMQGYKNGTQISTHNATSASPINFSVYVAACNFNGTSVASPNTLCFQWIGTGDMNFRVLADAVNKLQQVLGRVVV